VHKRKTTTRSAFEKLSAAEKERIYREIDNAPPGKIWSHSKPLTAAHRRRFQRIKKKLGRPKVGKSPSPIEGFIALPDAQKDAEVAEFEKGIDPKDWHPLTPVQRRQWARIQSKGGRPKVGKGAKIVPVSIERDLLKQVDSFAKRHKLKRSQMVAEGLRLIMKRAS